MNKNDFILHGIFKITNTSCQLFIVCHTTGSHHRGTFLPYLGMEVPPFPLKVLVFLKKGCVILWYNSWPHFLGYSWVHRDIYSYTSTTRYSKYSDISLLAVHLYFGGLFGQLVLPLCILTIWRWTWQSEESLAHLYPLRTNTPVHHQWKLSYCDNQARSVCLGSY